METKYYWIAIDKALKTLQVVEDKGCQAATEQYLQEVYNMPNRMSTGSRFSLFFNDTRDYIDYNKFYKKYAKWQVII